MKKVYFLICFLAACAASVSAVNANELIVSFVAETTTFNGPAGASPFNPLGPLGQAVAANPDLNRQDGQFIIKNFDPTFTGTVGLNDPGVEFFLHAPLLERLEANTTRIGGSSPNSLSTNTKILLPRTSSTTSTDEDGLQSTGFFGEASLTLDNGVPTAFSYSQGADALASFDFRFSPFSIESLDIAGTLFSLNQTYDLNTPGAADAVPYGLSSALAGNPGSTVLQTTRGLIQSEIDASNLLNTKQSSGGLPLAFNPLDGTGTLFHYNLNNATASASAVFAVPEPSSLAVLLLGGLSMLTRRRR